MAVRVTVVGQYDGRSLAAAQRDLDRLKRAQMAQAGPLARLGNTIRSNLVPALGMAAAAAGALAVKFAVDGVKAAIADQKTVEVLAQTLENLGQAHKQAGVEEFVASLESATGVADEELRPALGQLVIATGDVDEAQRRLQQAMDISIGTGQNLTTVVRAFQRALATGTSGTLSRYGIIIDDNTVKTQGFGAALDEAAGKFSGMADKEAKTLEGRLRILGVEFDNLKEAFGYGFINGLGESGDSMGDMADAIRELKPTFEAFGEQIGGAIRSLGTLSQGLNDTAEDLNIPRSQGAKNFVEYFAGLPGLLKTAATAMGLFKNATETQEDVLARVVEENIDYRDAAVRSADATREFADAQAQSEEEVSAAAEALSELNDEMKTYFGFLDDRSALRGYEDAVDSLRASLKENGKTFNINTEAGRENQEALDAVFQSALDVAEGQATAADKIATMEQASRDAKTQLDKTKLSEEAKQALLKPFDDAILKFQTATTQVGNLKAAMESLPTNRTITIDVETYYYGTPPPGGFPNTNGSAYGGYVDGYGGTRADDVPAWLSRGEFVIQAPAVSKFGRGFFASLNQGVNPLSSVSMPGPSSGGGLGGSGFVVETINVTSAPGERAEETVPRALRRMAFLAGV